MFLFLEIVVFAWGLRMIFKQDKDGWGLDNWVGVMMVTAAVLVEAIRYFLLYQDPYRL